MSVFRETSGVGILFWFALACGEPVPSPRADGEDATLGAARTLIAFEDARIDGVSADLVPIWAPLNRPLVVATDGSIAVVQRQDHWIRFFSAHGASLGSVGRRGEGPGEFGRIGSIGWLADSLWASDVQLRRLTVFAPDCEYARTVRVVSGNGGGDDVSSFLAPFALYADHTILGVAFADQGRVLLVRVDPDTRHQRTFFVLQTFADAHVLAEPYLELDVITPMPIFAVSPSGRFATVVRVTHDESPSRPVESDARRTKPRLVIAIVNEDGDTVVKRTVEVPGVTISRSVADSLIEAKASRLEPERARLFRRHAYVPPFWPPAKSVVISDDGSAWIQLRDPTGQAIYLVVDGRGDIAGTVTLPPNTVVAAVGDGVVWCLETDADDVQSIVRYRVQSASGVTDASAGPR